jgi:hypothetical protein
MTRSIRAVAGLFTGFLLLSSCSDGGSPTSPRLPNVSSGPSRLVGGLLAVQRATPLASDVTWSFTAGPLGASSTNADVGLTVTVPAGALATTETITVTALAGDAVAYRFEPHLEFARKVRLQQESSLINIAGLLLPMWGAHFDGNAPELLGGLVAATEQVPATLSILTGKVRFDVSHFTGWILASGNTNPPDSSGGSNSGQ